jgi:hypothetical protein
VVAPRPVADDKWHAPSEPIATPPAPPRAVRPADTLAGLAAELSQPAAPVRGPQVEPAPAALPAGAAVAPPITPTDQSLAEMAQRLEAALRRPAPPKMAVDGGARAADAKPAARPEPRPATPAAKTATAPPKPSAQPSDLEKEMASLLGGSGKT